MRAFLSRGDHIYIETSIVNSKFKKKTNNYLFILSISVFSRYFIIHVSTGHERSVLGAITRSS